MTADARLSVTVWADGLPLESDAGRIYQDGVHEAVAAGLGSGLGDAVVRTATLVDAEHGLTTGVLEATDVLAWWGHRALCDRGGR